MKADILSLVECEIFHAGKLVNSPGNEFKQLCLVRKGRVKMFDRNYNYLCELQPGSYFGEYQILFGLYSDFYYSVSDFAYIFKIEAIDFMKTICRDEMAYKHFFEISIQKLRFHTKIKRKLIELNSDKFGSRQNNDPNINNNFIKMYSILEMQSRNVASQKI